MEWGKTAIIASAAWLVISIAVGMVMVWQIMAHPMGGQIDRTRVAKAGDITGMMAGIGIGLICLGLFGRAKLWPPADRKASSTGSAAVKSGRSGSKKGSASGNRKKRRR
jgi:hypothetical protein